MVTRSREPHPIHRSLREEDYTKWDQRPEYIDQFLMDTLHLFHRKSKLSQENPEQLLQLPFLIFALNATLVPIMLMMSLDYMFYDLAASIPELVYVYLSNQNQ